MSVLVRVYTSSQLSSRRANPLLDGLHGHVGCLPGEDLRLFHGRYDIVGSDAPLLGEVRDGMGTADGHAVGNLLCPDQQGSLQDSRKAD